MIGYHWSPEFNRESILKRGLLVPTKHPRTIQAVTCSDGHLNPHISLARNPIDAWRLSAATLTGDRFVANHWDLWQVDLTGLRYHPVPRWIELQCRVDIPRSHVKWVAQHWL